MNEIQDSYTQGDNYQWEWNSAEHLPSDGWSLIYYFRGPSSLDLPCTVEGEAFKCSLTSSLSSSLVPGDWRVVKKALLDGEGQTIGYKDVIVEADLALVTSFDNRSEVKQTLDAINSNIKGCASKAEASKSIEGKSLQFRGYNELMQLQSRYEDLYNLELNPDQTIYGEF